MSLQSEFESALGGAAAPATVHASDGPLAIQCELLELNPVACRFDRITARSGVVAGAGMDRLKKISEDLSARLTYLMEPIGPVEHDSEQCVVQMRSKPPQKDDNGRRYYELPICRRGALSLCRYEKTPGAVRQVVPAAVTREVLLRLVGDFESVLS